MSSPVIYVYITSLRAASRIAEKLAQRRSARGLSIDDSRFIANECEVVEVNILKKMKEI
jgi:hypothetical protein